MLTKQTIDRVNVRSKGRCENPECYTSTATKYEYHHIYWKSQYNKEDRHDSFNIAKLCRSCHYSIHSQGNTKLDRYLKLSADYRIPARLRSKKVDSGILYQRRLRKALYRKKIEAYKASHNNLSPTQVKYRQQKAYRASIN